MKNANESIKNIYLFLITVYLLCLPLGAMNIGALGSALKILAILPVIVALFGGINLKCSAPIIGQLLFVLFATFSIVWTRNIDLSIDRVWGYILLFVLVASAGVFQYSTEEIHKIKSALIWSSRLMAVIVVLFSDVMEGRIWLDGVIAEDPNYLCGYWTFGVVGALERLDQKTARARKNLALIELLAYFLLVLLTGSRGGLLAIAACVIIFFLWNNRGSLGKKLLLMSAAILAFLVLINFLPEELQTRFTIENVVETKGTGRIDIWEQAIDLFNNGDIFRKLFGQGTATITWCFRYFGYLNVKVTHNIFLETLVELGIIGLFFYLYAIYLFVKFAWKRDSIFAVSILIGMVVLSLSTSIYTFKPYFNIMLFVVMLLGERKNCQNTPKKKVPYRTFATYR